MDLQNAKNANKTLPRQNTHQTDDINDVSLMSSQNTFTEGSQYSVMYASQRPATVDDYQILKVVGRGSFGKVYMVRRKSDGEIYAMKTLKKDFIIKTNQVQNTKTERDIMTLIDHPFVVKLHNAFQSSETLYFVTDFLNGGELFYHLCNEIRFSEDRARFYAAQLVLALEHLHENGIIYRDLKPENVLLDSDGHLKITDFGLSKLKLEQRDSQTNTFCGTPEYLAPEIIIGKGHNYAVDWWSLGMLLYEMISGINPFKQISQQAGPQSRHLILKRIIETDVDILPGFSSKAGNLLRGLLQRDPNNRLTVEQIKSHAFFDGTDWEAMLNKEIRPPFVPKVLGKTDISYIDRDFTTEDPKETYQDSSHLQSAHVDGFSYQAQDLLPSSDN